MTIRYWLVQLSDLAARRTFGRTWLGVCLSALSHIFLNIVVFHDADDATAGHDIAPRQLLRRISGI